jgi:hypothetical protein
MNDEFLTKIHKIPRAEFADALYERISQQSQPRLTQIVATKLTLRNSAIVFALLLLVAACVYAVTDRGWYKVGGFWVRVENTVKISIPPMPEELETESPVYDCMTLEEAREFLRFDLQVPTWAPEGFTFDDEACGVSWMGDWAGLYWTKGNVPFSIQLIAYYLGDTECNKIQEPIIGTVAPGSYKEVKVHGQPAILVRGDWDWKKVFPTDKGINFNSKWDSQLAVQLYWVDRNAMYHLYTEAELSAEDLIKIAESAQ